MAKRKVKLTTDPTEQANLDALNSQYETSTDTSSPDVYQGSADAMSALNDLIKKGNVHLNDIDMQEFLKADNAGKQAMIASLESSTKKRRVNLKTVGNPSAAMAQEIADVGKFQPQGL